MHEQEAVDLRWLLAVLRRWLWMIALWTALGLSAAYSVNRYVPPIYSSSSTLLIQAAVTDFQAIMTSERLARTYSQLLKERTVLETVILQLKLDETPITLSRQVKVNVVADTQLIRVTVEHPDPQLAAAIANRITQVFIEQVESLQTERYSDSLTSIKQQIDDLANQIDATQAKVDVLGTPRLEDDQAELARQEGLLAQYRATFTTLLQSYEQMRLSAAQSLQKVMVAERARVPEEPVHQLALYMSLAGILGLLIGVGVAFLLEYLDDTIKTAEDIRRALGLKTLGVIGTLPRGQKNTLIAAELSSAHGEAYRVLGANIFFSETEMPLRTLLVTSPTEMEGKSLTSANLAAALAQSGFTVALVEADMRRPTLGRFFESDPHSQGLASALAQGKLDGLLRTTAIEGLSLLDSGAPPANPTRLLGSRHLGELLGEISHQRDIVVIDSPPMLPVADAMLLARHVDGVVLVLRAGQTRWQAARQALDRLHQVKANVVGAVLNGVSIRHGSYYDSYYSKYHATDGKRRRESTLASDAEGARPPAIRRLISKLFPGSQHATPSKPGPAPTRSAHHEVGGPAQEPTALVSHMAGARQAGPWPDEGILSAPVARVKEPPAGD